MKHLLIAIMLTLSINANDAKPSKICAYHTNSMTKNTKRVRFDLEHKNHSLYANLLINDIQEVLIECSNVLDENTTNLLKKRRVNLFKFKF